MPQRRFPVTGTSIALGAALLATLIGSRALPAAQSPSGVAAASSSYATPRTPWGHPDLQGTYSNDAETGTPMERPRQFEGRVLADITPEELQQIVSDRNNQFVAQAENPEFAGGLSPPVHLIFDTFERQNRRAWLVVDPPDGRIPPLTDAARARPRAPGGVSTNANPRGPFNSWLDMGLYDRCITRGLPSSMMPAGYGSWYDITQSPDRVAIRYEMVHETRVIPIDARPHAPGDLRHYLGDGRGHWEGDTLVVETTNFRADTAPQRSSERVRMTERFSAVSPEIVEWSVTFDDPDTWTRPWTFMMPLTKVVDAEMHEYACHEGNHAMRNILSAARAEEK
jgi:hypothetical protein